MRKFSKSDLSDKSKIKKLKQQTSKRYVNGKLVSGTNTNEFKIQNAAQILRTKKTVPTNITNNSDMDTSKMVLNSLGVTLSKEPSRKLDFLAEEKQLVVTENPNLEVSDRLKKLKNSKADSTNKFQKADNPFYKLDIKPSDAYYSSAPPTKNNNSDIQFNCQNACATLFEINVINRTTKTLRQFK
jgi:hypothetical protein